MPNEFTPQWVSPPWDTILDALIERKITQSAFCRAVGIENTDSFERGEQRIDAEMSLKLSELFGTSPAFWLIRDAQYVEDCKRIQGTPKP
jgi:HTH-type transcriptional regulator / antitoxin HigA